MDYKTSLGINPANGENEVAGRPLVEYANMRLAAIGKPVFGSEDQYPLLKLAKPLLENYREFSARAAETSYCPPDERIMKFLEQYLDDVLDEREPLPSLPHTTFILDRFGTARVLSLAPDKDDFDNGIVQSYRVRQGKSRF